MGKFLVEEAGFFEGDDGELRGPTGIKGKIQPESSKLFTERLREKSRLEKDRLELIYEKLGNDQKPFPVRYSSGASFIKRGIYEKFDRELVLRKLKVGVKKGEIESILVLIENQLFSTPINRDSPRKDYARAYDLFIEGFYIGGFFQIKTMQRRDML